MWKKADKSIRVLMHDDASRTDYRVVPGLDEPILLQVDGRICHVLDISAGGISCSARDLQIGMRYAMRMCLTEASPAISGYVDVVSIDLGICHCRFRHLDDMALEHIHQYVLSRQKKAIQAIRASIC